MARTIIQIASAQSDGEKGGYDVSLFALCNDGTVWLLGPDKWLRVAAIPQGKIPSSLSEGRVA